MRYLYSTVIIAITLLFFSCKKEHQTPSPQLSGDLVGIWKWASTCGGFAGTCGYPTKENQKTITFTDSQFFGKLWNTDSASLPYQVVSQSVRESSTFYSVELGDGTTWEMVVHDNQLDIILGDLVESYKRIK